MIIIHYGFINDSFYSFFVYFRQKKDFSLSTLGKKKDFSLSTFGVNKFVLYSELLLSVVGVVGEALRAHGLPASRRLSAHALPDGKLPDVGLETPEAKVLAWRRHVPTSANFLDLGGCCCNCFGTQKHSGCCCNCFGTQKHSGCCCNCFGTQKHSGCCCNWMLRWRALRGSCRDRTLGRSNCYRLRKRALG